MHDVAVDREARSASDAGSTTAPDSFGPSAASGEPVSDSGSTASHSPSGQLSQAVVAEESAQKRWWKF